MGVKPILVCMVWRGGERFARCLQSIEESQQHFSRIVLSVTGDVAGADMQLAQTAQKRNSVFEVICTGTELPTMQHQAFWIDYLTSTGAKGSDWIYWLAYDDQIRARGIEALVSVDGEWPLEPATAYFGPWAMRHEKPDVLWQEDPSDALESWTSFPVSGPTNFPVAEWIAQQLRQPTYMQMSGSVNPLQSFIDLKECRPRKQGPMRIEMAIASAPGIMHVAEFAEPVSIIYGRSDSDRASYGNAARKEDAHLVAWLARYVVHHPRDFPTLTQAVSRASYITALSALGKRKLPSEEWRVRTIVQP